MVFLCWVAGGMVTLGELSAMQEGIEENGNGHQDPGIHLLYVMTTIGYSLQVIKMI
jgi:hypothetical protein